MSLPEHLGKKKLENIRPSYEAYREKFKKSTYTESAESRALDFCSSFSIIIPPLNKAIDGRNEVSLGESMAISSLTDTGFARF